MLYDLFLKALGLTPFLPNENKTLIKYLRQKSVYAFFFFFSFYATLTKVKGDYVWQEKELKGKKKEVLNRRYFRLP